MALIKCPECGNQVSSEAVACVKCGYPIRCNIKSIAISYLNSSVWGFTGGTCFIYKKELNEKGDLVCTLIDNEYREIPTFNSVFLLACYEINGIVFREESFIARPGYVYRIHGVSFNKGKEIRLVVSESKE